MLEVIAYIGFCLLTAAAGSRRRMGFFGTLIISLLVTPIPVLLVLLLTGPSHRHGHHWDHHWHTYRAPAPKD
jgi:hypothetical protein